MVLIVLLAVVCVVLKAILFPDNRIVTFIPLKQKVIFFYSDVYLP